MDIRKLQRAIVDGLEDVKGQNIVVFNTEHLSPLFERVVIASGTSNRQTKALAASVRDAVKSSGFPILRTEGEGNGEWIIVDCGAAVVHLMQPSIREYYHLEEIWGDKPVRLKLDTAPLRLVKAADAVEADGAKAPRVARKSAAKAAAGKTAAPRRPAVARPAANDDTTPAKAAARKLPAKTAARPLPAKAAVRKPAASSARAAGDEAAVASQRSPVKAAPKPPAKRMVGVRPSAGVTRTVGVKTKEAAARPPAARKAATKKTADSA